MPCEFCIKKDIWTCALDICWFDNQITINSQYLWDEGSVFRLGAYDVLRKTKYFFNFFKKEMV